LAPLLNELQKQQQKIGAQAIINAAQATQLVAQAAEIRELKQQQKQFATQAELKELKQELHAALLKLQAKGALVAQRCRGRDDG
jgi:hypothetical protein